MLLASLTLKCPQRSSIPNCTRSTRTMAPKVMTVEQRLTQLEEFKNDVNTVTRVRLENTPKVLELCVEASESRDFWQLKQKLAEALLLDLDPLLPTLFQEPRLTQIHGELVETLKPEWIVGVFAVATREFKDAKVLDVRLRFGLRAIRLHDLVKTELGPKLKNAPGPCPLLWIPMTPKEMERQRAKRRGRSRSQRRERRR